MRSFGDSEDSDLTKPLTQSVEMEPKTRVIPRTANGRHHVITITPVREEPEYEVDDDRFETVVYAPTVTTVENGTPNGGQLVPVKVTDGPATDGCEEKPKGYILVQDGGTETSAGSTPSDSRSMCDTPDSDPWTIPELANAGPEWKDLTTSGKIRHVGLICAKIGSLLLLLYFFICSLDLLSTAFRLLGSRAVGRFFSDNELLQNPVVGLMIGVLVTVLVQSSSTSTSIVVTMVASKIIHVRQAIPIVMGANIGTSVTNTIVSLMQSADRNEFRRAFAAATVHDMFNWLTVLVLLPIEITTRYLETLTTWIVKPGSEVQQDKTANREFLNALTKPFTKMVIQIDKQLLEQIASGNETDPTARLVIQCCNEENVCKQKCKESFFGLIGLTDTTTGIILLILSIVVLCTCLIFLVKVLNSMLTGHIAKLIKRTMNREYRFPYNVLSDYCAIFAGCILTILVQSSSIFTSALTPLAGIGVISLEKIYPLTLGSNIGTTTTGILAALAADSSRIHDTLQLALCHLFFNISGILLFYPIPCMRLPIPLARLLGDTTANYRWFSMLYLVSSFFVLPLIVFSLSTLGTTTMFCVGGPVFFTLGFVILINLIQHYHSSWLPSWFQNWHFLPLWMRSLEPLDRLIIRVSRKFGCTHCCGTESGASKSNSRARGLNEVAAQPGAEKQVDSTQASHMNLVSALQRSNSESQFENLIYSQGRIGMLFHGFGNHHTIHGIYNNPTMRHKSHRKSMAPAYNRAYYHNNNNNGTAKALNGGIPKSSDPFDPVETPSPSTWDMNHHTVHNPYEVHRYYPGSPFVTPTGSPNHKYPPLQVVVTQPNSPANSSASNSKETVEADAKNKTDSTKDQKEKEPEVRIEGLGNGNIKKSDNNQDDDDSKPIETNL